MTPVSHEQFCEFIEGWVKYADSVKCAVLAKINEVDNCLSSIGFGGYERLLRDEFYSKLRELITHFSGLITPGVFYLSCILASYGKLLTWDKIGRNLRKQLHMLLSSTYASVVEEGVCTPLLLE